MQSILSSTGKLDFTDSTLLTVSQKERTKGNHQASVTHLTREAVEQKMGSGLSARKSHTHVPSTDSHLIDMTTLISSKVTTMPAINATTSAVDSAMGQEYAHQMNTMTIVICVLALIGLLFTCVWVYELRVQKFYAGWTEYPRPVHDVLRVETIRLVFVDDDEDGEQAAGGQEEGGSGGPGTGTEVPAVAQSGLTEEAETIANKRTGSPGEWTA